jgi:hypothetical protein
MGLKFHDGTHKLYTTYTDGKAWNSTALLQNPPAWMLTWNTESLVTGILTNNKSKLKYKESATTYNARTKTTEKSDVTVNLLDIASSTNADVNLWILKGLHQQHDPHLTIGHDGFLWHMNVQTERLAGGRVEAYVTKMSRGDWGTQEDADGFTKVGK